MDRAIARTALEALVEQARRPQFNADTSEPDIRENLIVPLLRDVLGWNTGDISEFSRERYSRGAGFADGVLLVDGRPVVYLEAKRIGKIPALTELRGRAAFYAPEEEQALRYARRSTDMPDGERWTILTNFYRLRVFEATREDRVLSFETPEQLLDRFDELLLLSKEALLDGALRRHLEQSRKRPVDDEFRQTLNQWRRRLAQELYDRNRPRFGPTGDLDLRSLQSAVQRLLDRLIIVQFAADVDALGEEDPLRDLLALTAPARTGRALVQPPSLRGALFDAFRRFDTYYNTSIFAPGHLIESLEIGEDVLREIVESVAAQSFRRLDADILGTTYETYLGHQLRVVDDAVQLDLRPEVRRAGGVYYTPIEIVGQIVDRTVRARLAEAVTVEQVDKITVMDPACGSGSFLIRAFDAFADWYDVENARRTAAARHAQAEPTLDDLRHGPIEDYGRRILERNLYGVDLDPEAAELAAVNLIMQALRRGRAGIGLHRLPLVLGQNVKIGNSVVPGLFPGGDVEWATPGELGALRDARVALRSMDDQAAEEFGVRVLQDLVEPIRSRAIRHFGEAHPDLTTRSPFFWSIEYPEIFDPDRPVTERGFAVVVGNPPWIGFAGSNVDRPYLAANCETAVGRFDMYVPFVELALRLTVLGGSLGLITPSNYFLREYGVALRRSLGQESSIETIIDFGSRQLFHGATNYPAITVARRGAPDVAHTLTYLRESYETALGRSHLQSLLSADGWVFLTAAEESLLAHISAQDGVETLDSICRLSPSSSGLAEGIVTGQNSVFLVDRTLAAARGFEDDLTRPCVKGEDVARWSIPLPSRALIYPYRADAPVSENELSDRPNVHSWLTQWRTVPSRNHGLEGRPYFDASGRAWYELWNERSEALIGVPKLLAPEINDRPEFALVDAGVAFTDSVVSATPSPTSGVCREYLAGILNSKALALWHARQSVPKANGYLVYRPAFLRRLPVKKVNLENEREMLLHDEIVASVRRCVELTRALRDVDEDFSHYVEDFTITTRTLTSVLNLLGRDARENLFRDGGTVRRLTTRREGGRVIVAGEVHRDQSDDEPAEWEPVDLLRLEVPEPLAAFLESYLPISTRYAHAGPGTRTASSRTGDVLLPNMTDGQQLTAVQAYRMQLERGQALRAELEALEGRINDRVCDLYELTEQMRATVAAFREPAALMRLATETTQ